MGLWVLLSVFSVNNMIQMFQNLQTRVHYALCIMIDKQRTPTEGYGRVLKPGGQWAFSRCLLGNEPGMLLEMAGASCSRRLCVSLRF